MKYTDEELIYFYKKLGEELGKTPTQIDVNNKRKIDKNFPSTPVLSRRIGFNKLAELCGLKINGRKYTKNELLNILKKYYYENGIPTQEDFDNNSDLPSSTTYLKYFGGIRNALISMGLTDKKDDYTVYQNMTDNDIFKLIIEYYKSNGNINGSDFKYENGLPNGKYLRKRFGSLKFVYEKCNIFYNDMYFSDFKKVSNKKLLDKLVWFSENVGFPTMRNISKHDDMPSSNLYYNRFGSLKNAMLISGVEIPKERERYFDREKLSDEEMLSLLRYYTEQKLSNGDLFLMTDNEIEQEKGMPCRSTYYNRFNTIQEMYNLIGYNYNEFNKNALRKDMIEKYLDIYQQMNKVPTSRDIEFFSRNKDGYYSMSSYEFNFGSLFKLQNICGVTPTVIGRNKNKDELLSDLLWLADKIGRTPLMMDLYNFDNVASPPKYAKEFGGFPEALSLAGLDPNTNIYYTPKGTKCLSYYELIITDWFEKNFIIFEKEVPYNSIIKNDKTRRRFDWVIKNKNDTYYIEMFGMIGRDGYNEKTMKKIEDCKNNNIDLIAIYPKDIKNKSLEEIFSFLFT